MAQKKSSTRGVVDAATRAAEHLGQLGVSFALVGGLAVGARAEPRFTRDVDLVVSVRDDSEAERIVHAMATRGYVIETVVEHRRHHRLATARLRHPAHPEVFLDLLFASSGIESEVAAAAEDVGYGGGAHLPVARTGHLIALKVLSESDIRLQDRIDLGLLARTATSDDWTLAKTALGQIRAREYHRGRALLTRLRKWKRETRRRRIT